REMTSDDVSLEVRQQQLVERRGERRGIINHQATWCARALGVLERSDPSARRVGVRDVLRMEEKVKPRQSACLTREYETCGMKRERRKHAERHEGKPPVAHCLVNVKQDTSAKPVKHLHESVARVRALASELSFVEVLH